MDIYDLLQAISAGVCFYAGITHLMIGFRSQPRNRVHLSFALVSLLFGVYSVGLFALYAALETGSLAYYVFTDRWGIAANYLAYAALFWFIALYTGARRGFTLWLITALYILIFVLIFVLPYPWVYTDIQLTSTFPPDIVVAPWYTVEQVITLLLLTLYSGYHIVKQYRHGERSAARSLGIAIGIFLVTVLWDYGIEYGLVESVLMQQYGFVAFIVIMSLRLSGQTVEAEKEVRRLNIELEDKVEERTTELSQTNEALQEAKDIAEDARRAAEAANRAKSIFLANMSHELRTPLNAILGFTQIMERDPEFPNRHKNNLRIIDSSGEHLLELINDILVISKIEAGRASLEVSSFDLYHTLDELESILRVRAENKGLVLVFERDQYLPRYVRTDERKLRQVLINLLGNAVKFTQAGRVGLSVKSEDEKCEDKYLGRQVVNIWFQVEDTGVGIAAEEMGQLFEPFSQTESGQQMGEGSGLGLPISQQFVQLMGGEIRVESQVGKGSTFRFKIPVELVSAEELEPECPSPRVVGLAPDQPGFRILVVDDSEDNRELLRQILERVGYDVRTVSNGQAAIEVHQSWAPHLIWMDIRMPGMDGYAATQKIKAGRGSKTVVIAVTASAFEEQRAKVLEAGCDDFVRKPFKEAEIYQVMGEHLGARYIYEAIEPVSEKANKIDLAKEDLANLPDDWVEQLRESATRGRTQNLYELIVQIEPEYPEIAQALRAFVDNFEFIQIVALTEQPSQ